MLRRLYSAVRHGGFFSLYNFRSADAKGRCVMLSSQIIASCIGYLTGGVFYTAFLVGNEIDIVDLGIISFLPLLANCLSVFAPLILERFPKRRWVLGASKFLYYVINILGITVLPLLVADKAAKVFWFAVIVFVSNAVLALTSGGYSVWHLNFMPDNIRAEVLSYHQIFGVTISSAVLLVSSFVADALRDTPNQMTILYILRLIAFALATLEVILLLLPKEYPYERSERKISIANVFRLPLKHKKFMYSMLVIAMWTFASYMTSSCLYYYLLENVGVSYTFVNMIDAAYALFLIFLSRWWRPYVRTHSWFRTFGVASLILAPTTMLYSFVNSSNFVWIMLVVRLTQHAIGVGQNLTWANLPYVNLPKADQSNYLVFYTLVANLSGFLGLMFSTWFISITRETVFPMIFTGFTNVQLLLLVQGIMQGLIGLFILRNLKNLNPNKAE